MVLRGARLDHQLDPFNVEPAGGHVRGDQYGELPRFERLDGHLAVVLLDVAVEGPGAQYFAQGSGELVAVVLGVRKDNGATRAAVGADQLEDEFRYVRAHTGEK